MDWIKDIPDGVWYGSLIIIGMISFYAFALMVLTIWRGGRIKAGKVELDADPDAQPAPEVKADDAK